MAEDKGGCPPFEKYPKPQILTHQPKDRNRIPATGRKILLWENRKEGKKARDYLYFRYIWDKVKTKLPEEQKFNDS